MQRNITKVFVKKTRSTVKIKLFAYESKDSSPEEAVNLRAVINYM